VDQGQTGAGQTSQATNVRENGAIRRRVVEWNKDVLVHERMNALVLRAALQSVGYPLLTRKVSKSR